MDLSASLYEGTGSAWHNPLLRSTAVSIGRTEGANQEVLERWVAWKRLC